MLYLEDFSYIDWFWIRYRFIFVILRWIMIFFCVENCFVSDFMWYKIDSGGYYKMFGNVYCLLLEFLFDIILNYGDVCIFLLLRFWRFLIKILSKVW